MPANQLYHQPCGRWYRRGEEVHLCPAEDGDRTVTVPLAALRAVVELARSLADDADGEYGSVGVTPELQQVVEDLGVAGL